MRSPVETRCAGVADILRESIPKCICQEPDSRVQLLVNLKDSQDVAIHHQREEAQNKDEAHLNEALLERDAQIPAQRSFDCQQQHVSAVKNWDWQKIEQAKVEANHRCKLEQPHGASANGASRFARNSDHSGQISNRNLAAKKSSENLSDLARAGIRGYSCVAHGLNKALVLVNLIGLFTDSYLPSELAVRAEGMHGGDIERDFFSVAPHHEVDRASIRIAHLIHKLHPANDRLIVD